MESQLRLQSHKMLGFHPSLRHHAYMNIYLKKVVATLLAIFGSAEAAEPLPIIFENHGYLGGNKHVNAIEELQVELHELMPEEVRIRPRASDSYERVAAVLKIVGEIKASTGVVGYETLE